MSQPPKDMSSDAGERLPGKLPLGLQVLYERTTPGGLWFTGGYGVRTNTLFALEKRGLAKVRTYMGYGSYGYEAQITEKGQAWIEDRPVEA